MSQPNNTILNGPSGELTMAFKEAQKAPPQPQRPLLRTDSRTGQFLPQQQGPPRPFQGPPPGAPQFRPGNFPPPQNQQPQQRFGPGPPPGQPLFRPQQRFVAVNPPQRPNFRPPGPPSPVPHAPRIRLPQQQSFAGTLPAQRSVDNQEKDDKLQRSNTLDSPTIPTPVPTPTPTPIVINNVVNAKQAKEESKEEVKEVKVQQPLRANLAQEVAPHEVQPPTTLLLTATSEKNSSSPSPQPETVVESVKRASDKPPKVPRNVSTPTPTPKGDNDSGVDESTQGEHTTANGHSPRKTMRSGRLATPTKNRSFSRGSRSPHLMSPDSQPGTPGPTDRKKLPMNKIQVGSAPSPNLKVVKSKIGSLSNTNYKPGGGHVKIETKKVDVSRATSRIGAKNDTYAPSGGDKKIVSQKLQWNAKSKIGSLENAQHKPKGGDKKIETVRLDFKDKAKPKVGSKDNMQHVPGGGDIKNENGKFDVKHDSENKEKPKANEHAKRIPSGKILDRKLAVQAESKIGSMDNMKHRPGGGEKKIFDDKEYLRQRSAGDAMSNANSSVCGSQKKQQRKLIANNFMENPTQVNITIKMGKVVTILETVEESQRKLHTHSSPMSRNSSQMSLMRANSAFITPRPVWRY